MFKHLYALFDMGNYGWYVWPCYALLVVVCIVHLYFAFKAQRAVAAKFRVTDEPRT